MSLISIDPKKLKAKITRYERELRKEYETHQSIHDGSGKRYLIGPFYLLLDDVAGALNSFIWFEQLFPNDIGEPAHYLCWSLALYRSGDLVGASNKLMQAMLSNLYLLPELFGQKQARLNIRHSSNFEDITYLQYIPPEILKLWDAEALTWAQTHYEMPEFERVRTRYIEIYAQLQTTPVGPKRSQLVAESFALRRTTPGQG